MEHVLGLVVTAFHHLSASQDGFPAAYSSSPCHTFPAGVEWGRRLSTGNGRSGLSAELLGGALGACEGCIHPTSIPRAQGRVVLKSKKNKNTRRTKMEA